jgi:hypothetical protein
MPSAHRVSAPGAGTVPPVVLIGRPGCHLCADAEPVVRAVAAEFGLTVVEQSVDDDARLSAAYGDLIPVVLIDGEVHAYWRVDPQRLRAGLGARGR